MSRIVNVTRAAMRMSDVHLSDEHVQNDAQIEPLATTKRARIVMFQHRQHPFVPDIHIYAEVTRADLPRKLQQWKKTQKHWKLCSRIS